LPLFLFKVHEATDFRKSDAAREILRGNFGVSNIFGDNKIELPVSVEPSSIDVLTWPISELLQAN
jgi:hypothetical protein